MHIPDGFVNLPTAAATGAVSFGAVVYAVKKTGKELGQRTIPLLGVTAAFIFAAQMLNFPVAGGTSGHFLGGALALALLGPWGATLVLTSVLLVQALLMADGGITALGANIFNMGIVAVWVSYGVFYLVRRFLPRGHSSYLASLAAASWVSIVVASIAASLELAVSGVVPLGIALPAMSSVHMIIGLGEALITTVVVAAVYATRPDLVTGLRPRLADIPDAPGGTRPRTSRRMRVWAFAASALVVAVALAVFVSPFASSSPDGLEKVASDKGFESAAAAQPVWGHSPLPDYTLPGIGSAKVSTAVAGLVGTVLIFALVLVLGRTFARRGLRTADNPDSA